MKIDTLSADCMRDASNPLMRVMAVKCPTCGVAENGLLLLHAESLKKPWWCVNCTGPYYTHNRCHHTRLMFSVEMYEVQR